MTDRQRSEADTIAKAKKIWDQEQAMLSEVRGMSDAKLAATIAALREQVSHCRTLERDNNEQITALQSRVRELEAAINRWYADDGEALANIAVELLTTTTTEK